VEREEWEAWLASPVTQKVRQLILDENQSYLATKQGLDPRSFEDAHSFYAHSLVMTAKAESYLAMYDSLSVDAFDDIFEDNT